MSAMFIENVLFKRCLVRSLCTFGRKASRLVNREDNRKSISKRIMSALPKKNGHHQKFTICVEGNIASGKTSFLEYFKDTHDVEVIEEPVNKWRNVQGGNILAKMYEDPTRWSLTLQTYVQLTMLQNHVKSQEKPIKLMERSIYSAKYCFVENLHNSGKMPDLEFAVLSEWFDWILDFHKCPLDLIVYLQTTPEIVYDRIKKRKRKEEQTIPIEYLQTLHNLHEDWLIHQRKFPVPCKVLTLDANYELDYMHKVFEENRKKIMCDSG
ncbi:thymidine kinase 2, mitochondrial-like [Mytilus galloprovincialis]|uniref:thymidine kinase 2, mitochondrial-like n=1 Tax=Mytilus galloprovincialis TaxID=29158 RepID=UPI003F7C5DAD